MGWGKRDDKPKDGPVLMHGQYHQYYVDAWGFVPAERYLTIYNGTERKIVPVLFVHLSAAPGPTLEHKLANGKNYTPLESPEVKVLSAQGYEGGWSKQHMTNLVSWADTQHLLRMSLKPGTKQGEIGLGQSDKVWLQVGLVEGKDQRPPFNTLLHVLDGPPVEEDSKATELTLDDIFGPEQPVVVMDEDGMVKVSSGKKRK